MGPTCAPCSLTSENLVKNVDALSQCFLSVVNKRRLSEKGDEPSTCLGRMWPRSGSQATLLLRTASPQLVNMYCLQRHRCRYCIYLVTEGCVHLNASLRNINMNQLRLCDGIAVSFSAWGVPSFQHPLLSHEISTLWSFILVDPRPVTAQSEESGLLGAVSRTIPFMAFTQGRHMLQSRNVNHFFPGRLWSRVTVIRSIHNENEKWAHHSFPFHIYLSHSVVSLSLKYWSTFVEH